MVKVGGASVGLARRVGIDSKILAALRETAPKLIGFQLGSIVGYYSGCVGG